MKSLDVADASATSAALLALRRRVERRRAVRVAEREADRLAVRRTCHHGRFGHIPRWVRRGMGVRWQRVEALEHRVQMLLGTFAARGYCPSSSSLRTAWATW